MKKRSSPNKSRSIQQYTEVQLAGLRASTTARKQETVERLRAGIESLKAKNQAITAQTIYSECGLHYASFARNAEALALFRATSTHLTQKKKRAKRKQKLADEPIPLRDPLMNYKKPQLVTRLRSSMQRLQDLEQHQANLIEACLQRDARVAELETKIAELEPYRDFIEQVRIRIRREEHDDTPHV